MVFPESCNCEQRGKGKCFTLILSHELCVVSRAEISVLFSNIIGISSMIQCMLGSILNPFFVQFFFLSSP